MANPVLRAGPFAKVSLFDPFQDEPGSPDSNYLPVNPCLDTTSIQWVWKHYHRLIVQEDPLGSYNDVTNTEEYATGLPSVAEGPYTTSPGGDYISYKAHWYYQSYEDTTFTLDWDVRGTDQYTAGFGPTFFLFSVSGGTTIYESADPDDGMSGGPVAITFSGSQLITLPESTLPRKVSIQAEAWGQYTAFPVPEAHVEISMTP